MGWFILKHIPRLLQATFRFGFWLWIEFLHHTGIFSRN